MQCMETPVWPGRQEFWCALGPPHCQLVWFQGGLDHTVLAKLLNIGQTCIWVRRHMRYTGQAVDYFDHSTFCSEEYKTTYPRRLFQTSATCSSFPTSLAVNQ